MAAPPIPPLTLPLIPPPLIPLVRGAPLRADPEAARAAAPAPVPVASPPATPCPVTVSPRAQLLACPEGVHPALWRAQAGRRSQRDEAVLPSGFADLDAELPGGGWPVRTLTELLLPRHGVGELRLLAPALARLAQAGRMLLLADPPALVGAEGLAQMGLPPRACLLLRSQPPAPPGPRWPRATRAGSARDDLGWALEQALRSGQLGAVLAWPRGALRPEWLRRLQLAAQSHEGPVFLMRGLAAQQSPSPAPLRLALQIAAQDQPDQLLLHLLKRRGPALAAPLRLALTPVLSRLAQMRAAQPWGSEDRLDAIPSDAPAQPPDGAWMPSGPQAARLPDAR